MNRVVQFAVGKPRKIVEIRGNALGFFEMEGDDEPVGAGLEIVFHVSEERRFARVCRRRPCRSSRPTCAPICSPLIAVICGSVKDLRPSARISRSAAVSSGRGGRSLRGGRRFEQTESRSAKTARWMRPGMALVYRKLQCKL